MNVFSSFNYKWALLGIHMHERWAQGKQPKPARNNFFDIQSYFVELMLSLFEVVKKPFLDDALLAIF